MASISIHPGDQPSLFSNIVAGIDFSEPSTEALVEALRLAAERAQAALHIVHVARGGGEGVELDLPEGSVAVSSHEAVERLEAHVELARVRAMGHGEPIEADRVRVHVRTGEPAEEIKQIAKDLGSSLIVVGTHGRSGLKRLLLGSIAEAVAQCAPCTVLVVRPRSYSDDA
jgi:nucleotide-binding universal stress UspA family protein